MVLESTTDTMLFLWESNIDTGVKRLSPLYNNSKVVTLYLRSLVTPGTVFRRHDRVSSMSYSTSGHAPSYVGAWTPEQESVVSGYTDASIYASLQRQPQQHHHHRQQQQQQHQQREQIYQPATPQQQQQHTYQRLQHPRPKPTYVSLRGVNASRPSTLKRQQRYDKSAGISFISCPLELM